MRYPTLSPCKVDISLHLDTISIQYWFLRTPWVLFIGIPLVLNLYTSCICLYSPCILWLSVGIPLVYLLYIFVYCCILRWGRMRFLSWRFYWLSAGCRWREAWRTLMEKWTSCFRRTSHRGRWRASHWSQTWPMSPRLAPYTRSPLAFSLAKQGRS